MTGAWPGWSLHRPGGTETFLDVLRASPRNCCLWLRSAAFATSLVTAMDTRIKLINTAKRTVELDPRIRCLHRFRLTLMLTLLVGRRQGRVPNAAIIM